MDFGQISKDLAKNLREAGFDVRAIPPVVKVTGEFGHEHDWQIAERNGDNLWLRCYCGEYGQGLALDMTVTDGEWTVNGQPLRFTMEAGPARED